MPYAQLGFLAQTQPPGFDTLAQYGAVGVVAAVGLWFMWQAYRRETRVSDTLRGELVAVRTAVDEKFLPLVAEMIALLRSKDAEREQQILLALDRLQQHLDQR